MTSTTAPRTSAGPLLASLTGLTSLAILLQAITAGQFSRPGDHEGWETVHQVVGDAVVIIALATLVAAFATVRRTAPNLVTGTAVLFVLIVVQTVVGHIMGSGSRGLIALHIPLALLVFGLTVWVSIQAALLRRAG